MLNYPHKCLVCHCYLLPCYTATCNGLLSFDCLQTSKIIHLMILLRVNDLFYTILITYGVLSSVYLAISTLFVIKNKSYIKMLKNRGPNMEP